MTVPGAEAAGFPVGRWVEGRLLEERGRRMTGHWKVRLLLTETGVLYVAGACGASRLRESWRVASVERWPVEQPWDEPAFRFEVNPGPMVVAGVAFPDPEAVVAGRVRS